MKLLDSLVAMAGGKKSAPDDTGSVATGEKTPVATGFDLPREKVLEVVRGFLAPIKTGPASYEVTPPPSVPLESFAVISAASPESLATAEQVATLKRLDGEYRRAWSLANSLTREAAKNAFIQQQSEAAARARVGGGREAQDAWSLSDFEEDYRARCRSAKQGANEAAGAASETILAIADAFRKFAEKAIEDELVTDYRRFQRFGVPFKPSLLVETLSAALSQLPKHLPREGKAVPPASAAKLFGITIE